MKKYIAYYRVSTNKQSLGLDAQRNSVLSYLNNDNTNILISEFVEKESGKNNNRIQLSNAKLKSTISTLNFLLNKQINS